MASSILSIMCTTCVIIFLASTNTSVVEGGREFKVGDHLGWHQPLPNNTVFYIQWAERNRFQVGDSLLFEYQNDSVLTVEKMDYINCDTSNPITEYNNGNSIVNLGRPGAFFFISGNEDHCINGQKLVVEVMSPHQIPKSSPSPSPSISLPPEGSSEMAPSPSPYASDHSLGDSTSASASLVLGPVPMASLTTFVIVFLLTP
ncbi:hypothetical protein TanjilG_04411 [Lupinus angustifolius]|uniref:Phytocyanin domain-containing protein n=1 Tax=Lupinus angustifolius TaxID=3871 RepID=A0A4P1RQF6_LUPAN|nr:PREDICTED: early nodulin-like protein 1 [Lupinus angustifolius]OIW15876.1 hypothetical protein TanjilG_04411 [Lupinus angustifolius]